MMNASVEHIFDKPDLEISGREIMLFSNVRNEGLRLPYFFSYYRRLGVDRFFIVDNDSTDDTAAVIKAQPDAHYFHTGLSYAAAAGRNWTSELASYYGVGHWCLVADADELFVFPGVEFLSIRDFTEYLDQHEYAGAFGVFLDMYYPGTLDKARYTVGSPFLNTCSWFDTGSYWLDVAKLFPRVDIGGGPRWRKFWNSDGGGTGPTMRKHLLVKWRPGFDYHYSTHSMIPIHLADVTTAVLHFKFFSGFSQLAKEEHGRGDRFRPDHYEVYKNAAREEAQLDFSCLESAEYRSSATLVRSGYLSVSKRYEEFLRRKANERVSASSGRYKVAVEWGVARDLPLSLADFVEELVSAAEEAGTDNRMPLNQLCKLWPILSASLESAPASMSKPQDQLARKVAIDVGHERPDATTRAHRAQRRYVGGVGAKHERESRDHAVCDLTVCVTAHSETAVAGPTMSSCEAAMRVAEAKGLRLEYLIALDAPTADCRVFFTQPDYASWTVVEFDYHDVGLTRNAITEMANGRWISFLDADDLFSENWLSEGVRVLRAAEAQGRRVIVHPEINWIFDGVAHVFTKPNQSDPLFSPHYFQVANYYDSLFMAPKKAYQEVPFIHRDIINGLSFQDWQFGIESMSAGWEHVYARNTAIFKRRRDSSLVTESSFRRAIIRQLPAMAIDRISKLGSEQGL